MKTETYAHKHLIVRLLGDLRAHDNEAVKEKEVYLTKFPKISITGAHQVMCNKEEINTLVYEAFLQRTCSVVVVNAHLFRTPNCTADHYATF
ncbi:hypothetical protein BaRGS_00026300 [Batillaria attramentaria]|uniref:Uncharacterized protein n=1 Tax=Batillaria attramentaria TaxID=370345 RepID=A0ABD0K6J8_9CAEN